MIDDEIAQQQPADPVVERLGRLTTWTLGGLILLAPLPFGSIQGPWWHLSCAAALALSLPWLWRALTVKPDQSVFPESAFRVPRAAFAPFFAMPAIHLLQLVPLPRFLLRLLSQGTEGFLAAANNEALFAPISINPDATLRALLLSSACAACVVLAARGVHKRKHIMALFIVFIVGGLLQSLYGLGERFSGHNHVLWYLKRAYLDSATGTLINRNHFAALLELALGASFGMIVYRVIRSQDSKTDRSWGFPERVIVHSVAAMLILAGLIASLSRAGIAAALLSILCVGVGLGLVRSRRATLLAALVLVAGTIGFALWIGNQPLAERISGTLDEQTEPSGRFAAWRDISNSYQDFVLLGSGGGTFEQTFMHYRSPQVAWAYNHAHNEFLEDRVETGILGVLARLVGLFAVFVSVGRLLALRHSRLARALATGGLVGCSAVVLHALFDFPWRMPAVALQFHILLGLTLSAASQRIEAEKIRVKRRRRRSRSGYR